MERSEAAILQKYNFFANLNFPCYIIDRSVLSPVVGFLGSNKDDTTVGFLTGKGNVYTACEITGCAVARRNQI